MKNTTTIVSVLAGLAAVSRAEGGISGGGSGSGSLNLNGSGNFTSGGSREIDGERLARVYGNATQLPVLQETLRRFANQTGDDIRRQIADEFRRRVAQNGTVFSGGSGGGGDGNSTSRAFRDRDFLKFDLSDNRLRVESGSRPGAAGNGTTDRLAFTLDTSVYPTLRLQYFNRTVDTASSFAQMTAFLRLAEFNDTVSPFQSANSVNLAFSAPDWTSLRTGIRSAVNADGLTTKSVVTKLLFPLSNARYPGLNVTLEVMFSNGVTVAADGSALSPSSLKYNLYVENFPFRMVASRLGLVQAVFHRELEVQLDSSAGAGANSTLVNIGGGKGQFAWDGTVTADGQERPVWLHGGLIANDTNGVAPRVNASDAEFGTQARILVFSLPRAQKILWDPYFAATAQAMTAEPQTSAAVNSGGDSTSDGSGDGSGDGSLGGIRMNVVSGQQPSSAGLGATPSAYMTVLGSLAAVCAAFLA